MPALGTEYAAIYDQMVAVVADSAPDDTALVAFWPIRGIKYDGNLLVVGRAVNGWDEETAWTPSDGRSASCRARVVQRARETSEPGDTCALEWVWKWAGRREGYNTNRSAFWQTAKNVAFPQIAKNVAFPQIVPEAWSSHFAWTNLYKIAPKEGRNPSERVCDLQFERCAELLRYEISAFQPKKVLIMAGRGWFEPFADRLSLPMEWSRGYVEGTGTGHGARWVVTKHPERKPRAPIVEGARRSLGLT